MIMCVYSSGSQPVSRDTQVCRQILKYNKMYLKQYYFYL